MLKTKRVLLCTLCLMVLLLCGAAAEADRTPMPTVYIPPTLATEAPTPAPTAEPTVVPTAEPTAVPTPVPTVEPTAVPTPVPTATPEPVYERYLVKGGALNLRTDATTKSDVLEKMNIGTVVYMVEKNGDWAYVRKEKGGLEGWAMTKYLEPAGDLTPIGVALVTYDGPSVTVRVKKDTGSTALAKIPSAAVVDVLEDGGKWLKVHYAGAVGYVLSSTVTQMTEAELAARKEHNAQFLPEGVDMSRPMIAFSFDDGPSEHTMKVLQILRENGAHATFFMQGHRMEEYAKEVAQVIADGNEIGTHTWSHNNLTKLSAASIRSNLQKCIDLTYQMTGQKVTLLRPPGGNTNKNARSVCGDMGLYIVNWSVDSRDWESRNASKIYNEIMKEVGPGAIVLCHDIYSTTAAAMERVIPELVRQGYQIVTVSELLACRVDGVQPGIVYTRVAPYNLAGYEPAVE